jgi:hypothetical protein
MHVPGFRLQWSSVPARSSPAGDTRRTRSKGLTPRHFRPTYAGANVGHPSIPSKHVTRRKSTQGLKPNFLSVGAQHLTSAVVIGHGLPTPGELTQQLKVLDQEGSANSLTLRLSAPAGSRQTMMVRINDPHIRLGVEGAQAPRESGPSLQPLQVDFGSGEGYVEKTVKFTW